MAGAGRNLDGTRALLARWLTSRLGASSVEITGLTAPANTGFSHETLLVDADIDGETIPLVTMLSATGDGVFPDPDPAREYGVIEALASTGVPVARPLGFEPDAAVLGAPFYVLQRIDGAAPEDSPPYTFEGWLMSASEAEQASVWWSGIEALASVHRADVRLPSLLGRGSLGVGSSELEATDRYIAWATEGETLPSVTDAMAWLRRAAPPPVERSFCWGDARLPNQMFRDGRCVAVLDWEMVNIGDPEADLGWWIYFDRLFSEGLGMPRLPGFPPFDHTIKRYEELTGRAVRDIGWFQVYAGVRFAVILSRLMRLHARRGEQPLGPNGPRDNFALAFLATVLAEARA